MAYAIKYAVVAEIDDEEYEVVNLCDSMEEAEDYIQEMEEDEE